MAGMMPPGGPGGPQGPAGGLPPGGPPVPPPPPPPAPPQGLAPRPPMSPFGGLTDLSTELPPQWQMVDGVCRQLKLTMIHPGLAKMPKVVAVLQSALNRLTSLLSHYTQKGDGGGAPTSVAPTSDIDGEQDSSDAHFTSSDADAQPSPDSGS